MVLPSSALRNWTAANVISVPPHFSQVSVLVAASVRILWRSTVWTVDSFCRSSEGKSDGFVCVTISLKTVSRSLFCQQSQELQRCDFLRTLTLVLFAAGFASEDVLLVAFRCGQKITAAGTEYQGADHTHFVQLIVFGCLL